MYTYINNCKCNINVHYSSFCCWPIVFLLMYGLQQYVLNKKFYLYKIFYNLWKLYNSLVQFFYLRDFFYLDKNTNSLDSSKALGFRIFHFFYRSILFKIEIQKIFTLKFTTRSFQIFIPAVKRVLEKSVIVFKSCYARA